MAQPVEYPAAETKVSDAFKCDMPFNGTEPPYEMWSHDVISFMSRNGVAHHLVIDDSGVVPGQDDVKAAREFNRLVVHQILNFNIRGNAKLRVIGAEFQGKPALVWKTMKSTYGVVSAARAEQYQEELRQFTARDGETIADVDA